VETHRDAKEKQMRLEIVDSILWNANPGADGQATGSAWLQGPVLSRVIHVLAALAMRALEFRMTDWQLLIFQDTVSGPWQASPGVQHRSLTNPRTLSMYNVCSCQTNSCPD
jgi:hypothetical protein